ncbi:MAG: glycine--tRNA ligase [Candidatus Pacebacteria bacterium]|nr:glycine--tRNA ligase [Candidatus Paceibacterota bacterium]
MSEQEHNLMEKIVSLAKRRGFVFQSSELYGGLAGFYDYGPLGSLLKNNVKESWLKKFVHNRTDMFLVDAAIVMGEKPLTASGHVGGFSDPMVECKKCKKRFRADQILESLGKTGDIAGMTIEQLNSKFISGGDIICECGAKNWSEVRSFNMMLKTQLGAVEDSSATAYLRPETAQGIFVNYKNIVDSMHPKMPFGVAQIGKAYRNEITPRDFLFRQREFEQMEIEYFIHPGAWEKHFEYWKDEMTEWMEMVGIDMDKVHDIEVGEEDRAHYSQRTIDFEFDFPFGQKELFGLAYRGDYDLGKHAEYSKQKLQYTDQATNETFIPHVIEPSMGLDRAILALLVSAYREDEMNGEVRTYLKLAPQIAPYTIAVSPLLKNKPELVEKAQSLFGHLKTTFHSVTYDDNGNIGKRYRRQDEIGTPFCVVVDFETLEGDAKDTVTVRDRDTGNQERIAISELESYFKEKLSS